MQWMRFKKSDPDTLFYKTTFNPDMPFSEYNMMPKNKVNNSQPRARFVQQLPSKRDYSGIKPSKFKDLKELIQYVPTEHHLFYRSLKVQPTRNLPRRGEVVQNDDNDHGENAEEEEVDHIVESDSD